MSLLRSSIQMATRYYKHFAPTELANYYLTFIEIEYNSGHSNRKGVPYANTRPPS